MILLCEEMHQALAYCHWKAKWWIQQQVSHAMRLPEGDLICKGMEAYAKQQVVYELLIAQSWEERWLPVQQ